MCEGARMRGRRVVGMVGAALLLAAAVGCRVVRPGSETGGGRAGGSGTASSGAVTTTGAGEPATATRGAAAPAAVPAPPGARADFPNLIVEQDVAVPMRDGVVLRADVYRPAVPGKYPT